MINIIEINLVNDELNSASRCSEPLERLITEFNMNEIFIPEKVTEKIKKFIIDFNKYTSVLEDLDDLKDRQAELKLNEQDSNSDAIFMHKFKEVIIFLLICIGQILQQLLVLSVVYQLP